MRDPTPDKSLIGAAGVHWVAAHLSLRGLIALPTIRNTAGVDIVAVDKEGSWVANIQVKTSRSKATFWPVSSRFSAWVGRDNYYAFLRYLKRERRFEVFLEHADQVANEVADRIVVNRKKGLADWTPCWYLPEHHEKLSRQWEELGPGLSGS
jgi:hypothetical protein